MSENQNIRSRNTITSNNNNSNSNINSSSSEINLTKSELYSIYGNENEIELENDNNEIYDNLKNNKSIKNKKTNIDIPNKKNHTNKKNNDITNINFPIKLLLILFKLIVLSLFGNLYINLYEQIHNSNPVLPNLENFKLIYLLKLLFNFIVINLNKFSIFKINNKTNKILNMIEFINNYLINNLNSFNLKLLNNSVEGILLGLIQPILVSIFKYLLNLIFNFDVSKNKKNLNLNSLILRLIEKNKSSEIEDNEENEQGIDEEGEEEEEEEESSSFDIITIVRSLVIIVGISYCFKKLEWNSPLQASITWSILNLLLWFILDSTLLGFLSASLISILMMFLFNLLKNYDNLNYSSNNHNNNDGSNSISINSLISINNLFLNNDNLADSLWIGSFLFIGLIIFGKIGKFLFS
ncbi:unnamed protein product [[Candida] boidinii]|nr:unnamed protein product [[Candida] boidinii]